MCKMADRLLENHPVLQAIDAYRGKDKVQSRLAFKVYMDLTEAKGWWNVRTHFCEHLDFVFISGHASRSKAREVILPLPADTICTPAAIQSYIQHCRLSEYRTEGLVLGLGAPDSNTVYYRVTDGLVPPEPPEVTEWKKYRREELPQLQRHHTGQQTAQYIRDKTSTTTDS